MATAASVQMDWDEDEEIAAREETEVCQKSEIAEGPTRLIRHHREKLQAEIERAQSIFEEEPPGDCSKETLDRATAFLKTHIERLWQMFGVVSPIPMIGPGPNGSVDLYWKQTSWELLVNVPGTKETQATFYGHDHGQQKAKGSFDPTKFSHGIAAWFIA